eukprot:CAMPEP_0175842858 /NCGR_PEP_ID=MMETSP0107_2-20121207/20755_1 /TAXON_ID=195067 ORGANISM="Goniomonas pacifica, Strain CCMP1869" /NCGR_SAMPLE_ID=MMETSP0107_2 /ASSEMBLY_ACC=CAM_ASM_000203 /LENGTH=126 /DNA_ID=CAMNT_0017157057 /DNA_START=558 /DNA_END=938 /DNA_ORIENTATION=-
MLRPSGETATDVTEDLCPSRVARNSPLSASKTCMMRSVGAGHAAVAEMMLRPSGEYVTELLRKGRPFTFRVIRHSALSTSQTCTVREVPATMLRPSGEYTTELKTLESAFRVARNSPLCTRLTSWP